MLVLGMIGIRWKKKTKRNGSKSRLDWTGKESKRLKNVPQNGRRFNSTTGVHHSHSTQSSARVNERWNDTLELRDIRVPSIESQVDIILTDMLDMYLSILQHSRQTGYVDNCFMITPMLQNCVSDT